MADIKYTPPIPRPTIPIPIPDDFVPVPFPDKQESEYQKNTIIYNGVTGLPKINAETGQHYI